MHFLPLEIERERESHIFTLVATLSVRLGFFCVCIALDERSPHAVEFVTNIMVYPLAVLSFVDSSITLAFGTHLGV